MRWRVVSALWILATLPLAASCGGSSGPSGPLAAVTAVASRQAVTDVTFEAYLTTLNLQQSLGQRAGEILDQLRQSRSAVNAQVEPIALTSFAGRQGAMAAGATGVIMPLLYADTLANALDPLTSGRSSGGASTPSPLSSTSEGATTTTTTFLNTTMLLSASGARVMLTMHWTYRETTSDKASGQKLVDLSDDRTMVGFINVCPDAAGIAAASLDVHIQISGSGATGASARTSTSSNTFSGHVDDQAVLRRVAHDLQQKASWQGNGGAGGYDASVTNLSWNAGASGITGGIDSGSVGGSVNADGAATAAQAEEYAGRTAAIDMAAVEAAYTQAQKLWRKGRCVVIQAPTYGAETPVEVSEQEKIQHDEEVDTGSLTKFGVGLRHRFGGALNQPVKASLSGDKKLEPADFQSGSGSLSYTAPDQQDKQASVTLKSVSKRGIGTLVLAFHTKGKHVKLSATGTSTEPVAQLPTGLVQFVVSLTIGTADFHKVNDSTWEATAQSKGSGGFVNLPGDCPIGYSEAGTVTFVATRDTRAGKSVWVVHMDQARSGATVTGGTCGGGLTVAIPKGGKVVEALNLIGEIVLPDDGGTVTLSASSSPPQAPQQVSLTFTATVTEG